MDANNLFASCMLGYGSTCAQDAFLQIREQVINTIPKQGQNLLLALDIKEAFVNIGHQIIFMVIINLTTLIAGQKPLP